jgi:hypothetical protein
MIEEDASMHTGRLKLQIDYNINDPKAPLWPCRI